MKSIGTIKHKLKQVRFRYMKHRIEASLCTVPENCAHNDVFTYPRLGTTPVRVCGNPLVRLPDGGGFALCDSAWEDRAPTCPHFLPRTTKDEVKAAFDTELHAMTLADVAREYPDMAALVWVLGDDPVVEDVPPPPPEVLDAPDAGMARVVPPVEPAPSAVRDDAWGSEVDESPARPTSWWSRIFGRAEA